LNAKAEAEEELKKLQARQQELIQEKDNYMKVAVMESKLQAFGRKKRKREKSEASAPLAKKKANRSKEDKAADVDSQPKLTFFLRKNEF